MTCDPHMERQVDTVMEASDIPERGAELRDGFRLGDWVVRPIEGTLEGPSGSRHLQPKSMDVLLCLATAGDHIVERDELIDQVWGQTAVTDEPLTRCIHDIRRALDDTRDKPKYIQTVPKRGYRLVAAPIPIDEVHQTGFDPFDQAASVDGRVPVSHFLFQLVRRRVVWVGMIYTVVAGLLIHLAGSALQTRAAGGTLADWALPALFVLLLIGFPVAVFLAWSFDVADEDRSCRRPRSGIGRLLLSRQGIDLLAVAVLLAVLAGFALDFNRPQDPPLISVTPRLSSIAILPFDVERDSATDAWLGEGIAEDVLLILDAVETLDVASRTSSFRRYRASADLVEIGQDLQVQYLLKGRVDRAGQNIRITVRLIDALTRFRLWGETFDVPMQDLFAVEHEIAARVLAALDPDGRSETPATRIATATNPPTTNPDAYENYLQARSLLGRNSTDASLDLAAGLFTRAIELDADFAAAYTGLCQTLVRQSSAGSDNELARFADRVCLKAVTKDPGNVLARTAVADLFRVTGRHDDAIEQYRAIVDSSPRAVDAYRGIGRSYDMLDMTKKADRAFRNAIEIKSDYGPAYEDYGFFLADQGRHREVQDIGRRLIQLDPDSTTGYELLATASFSRGQFAAAIAAYREMIRREPTAAAFASLGLSLYYLGRYRDAALVYQRAVEFAPLDHTLWRNIGDVYMQIAGGSRQAEDAYYMARSLAETELESDPQAPAVLGSLAYYCAALGERECAWRFSASATDLAPNDATVQYLRALVNLRLGHDADAVDAAERALQLGYPRALFDADPLLAPVRNSPMLADVVDGPMLGAAQRRAAPRVATLFP